MFDGHGSERTVANSSQTVTGTLNLDAFGVQAGSTGSSTDPYMYAATSGYRNDGDVGLSLVGARYYDAAVGRFITRDTDLSQAPYCYCEGDPINKTDPSGHGPVGRWITGYGRWLQRFGLGEGYVGVGIGLLGLAWLYEGGEDKAVVVIFIGLGLYVDGWRNVINGIILEDLGKHIPI